MARRSDSYKGLLDVACRSRDSGSVRRGQCLLHPQELAQSVARRRDVAWPASQPGNGPADDQQSPRPSPQRGQGGHEGRHLRAAAEARREAAAKEALCLSLQRRTLSYCERLCYPLNVLLADAPLTLREFVTHEAIPLATVFREVLAFLSGRSDVIVFGAHAVNAYCDPERMTQDVDLLSTRASGLAEDVRAHLAERLHIAARVRDVGGGQGHRVYQVRKPVNRHLVDVRQVDVLPRSESFGEIRVLAPPELVAMKVVSLAQRAGRPKAGTDLVDVQRLLLAFPDLKVADGMVASHLRVIGASEEILQKWRAIAEAPLEADDDDAY